MLRHVRNGRVARVSAAIATRPQLSASRSEPIGIADARKSMETLTNRPASKTRWRLAPYSQHARVRRDITSSLVGATALHTQISPRAHHPTGRDRDFSGT